MPGNEVKLPSMQVLIQNRRRFEYIRADHLKFPHILHFSQSSLINLVFVIGWNIILIAS
jgi:hypothetical protein